MKGLRLVARTAEKLFREQTEQGYPAVVRDAQALIGERLRIAPAAVALILRKLFERGEISLVQDSSLTCTIAPSHQPELLQPLAHIA